MEQLIVLLVAISLVILGARGTYKALWNSFFPNEPIVTTPVSTTPNATTPSSSGPYIVPAQPNTTANPSSQAPTVTPNVPTQSGQKVTVITGGGAYPVTPIGGNTQWTPLPGSSGSYNQPYNPATNNRPSWWPSWLPWPGA